jgi:putative oxygen-independent coproporphyrinogen III oxidase
MKHLYVHIPFCRSRCAYCDFASEAVGPHARAGRVQRYFDRLRSELAERLGEVAGAEGARGEDTSREDPTLETIYLGGGTPTAVSPDLLLPFTAELAGQLESDGEFTIEANPGTIDARLLARLADAGVTRLSLGVQSFAPALRAALGRRVTQREIEEALAAVAVTQWPDWNLDLIFGIPGQTWATVVADLDMAVAAGPTHISLYDLTYAPSFVHTMYVQTTGAGENLCGEHATPVEAAQAFAEEHYGAAVARLEAAGYRRYEVSNFALPGHECRHNRAYWRGEEYLGLGASAVSTVGGQRWTNPRAVAAYLAGEPPEVELLSPATRLFERAMLGLRMAEGVDTREVLPVLEPTMLRSLLDKGFVEEHYGKLRLNTGFLDVSNAVIAALLVHPGDLQLSHRDRHDAH